MPAEKMKKNVEATAKTAKATMGSMNPSTVKGKKALYHGDGRQLPVSR